MISHVKNDVNCRHLSLNTEHVFHVSRLSPDLAMLEEALDLAKRDKEQFGITSINFYTGNPHVRTSLVCFITWEDGSTSSKHYSADLASFSYYYSFSFANYARWERVVSCVVCVSTLGSSYV